MRRHILAAAAILALVLALFPAPTKAQAAPVLPAAVWVCHVGNESKVSDGDTYYRAVALCTGKVPGGKSYYRIRALFSVLGTGVGDLGPYHGKWVKPGKKSATKWVKWPYWPNAEGRSVRYK